MSQRRPGSLHNHPLNMNKLLSVISSQAGWDSSPRATLKDGSVYSCGVYFPRQHKEHWRSPWSQAVAQVKRHNLVTIRMLGEKLAQFLEPRLQGWKPYVITYVSEELGHLLFWNYGNTPSVAGNLAHAIFSHLNDKHGVAFERLLVLIKGKPKKQHRCRSISERQDNVKGCYGVDAPHLVAGRNIILVDDVLTSGATMQECARVLWIAGASTVIGVVLANTIGWCLGGRMSKLRSNRQAGGVQQTKGSLIEPVSIEGKTNGNGMFSRRHTAGVNPVKPTSSIWPFR